MLTLTIEVRVESITTVADVVDYQIIVRTVKMSSTGSSLLNVVSGNDVEMITSRIFDRWSDDFVR